jgi:arylsulfatase A-like enzyme
VGRVSATTGCGLWNALLLALMAAPLPPLLAGCGGSGPPARNVLLISVDTLRADHLGLYGYARDTSPAMDRLASEGVTFDRAIVQWPVTTPSMTSMFSGHYPHVTGIVIAAGDNMLPDRLLMLAEAFRDRGHRTAAVVANGVLGRHNNFAQGFQVYRELWKREGDPARRTDARHVTDAALEELRDLAPAGEPFLLWVHYVDPHFPYDPPDGYAEAFERDSHYRRIDAPVNADDDAWRGIPHGRYARAGRVADLGRYIADYDGEIRYTDEQIGRLLEGLDASPAADATLVALVADHGESLGEHDFYLNHGHVPYEEQLRVPLIFRWPDRRHAGRRIGAAVEVRGLARTLLAAVGTPDAENPFEGTNLLPVMEGGATGDLPAEVFSEAGSEETRVRRSYTLAMHRDGLKLVLPRTDWARERAGGRELELFDLARDPDEQRDLGGERRELAESMRHELLEWFFSEEPWPRHTRYDPERADRMTRQALRELGYVR